MLGRMGLLAAWMLASVAAWAWVCLGRRREEGARTLSSWKRPFADLTPIERFCLLSVAGILAITALVALVSPPNTWDAMQYNMPRVVMWLQHGNVRLYPTDDYQQLTMAPWADYAMTLVMALHGSDRFVNTVEWFCFLGSIVGASLIVRELGGGRLAQILAALLCATIPHAILAASSAKPDEAVAFWIVLSLFFLFRFRSSPSAATALLAASAIGLAILTKGTAYLLLPALLAAVFLMWPWSVERKFLRYLPAVALVVLALNAPVFYRNISLSGSPLGFASPDGEADVQGVRRFANAEHDPRDVAANVLRNLALHLETPVARINSFTERSSRDVISAIGANPDDQAMIEGANSGGRIMFTVPGASRSEVMAGNFIHLILFLSALPLLWWLAPRVRRDALFLVAGIAVTFVIFCAGLRWQPWNARFHLPLFIAACAIIAVVAASRLSKPGIAILVSILVLGAMPYALANDIRPIINTSAFRHPHSAAAANIFTLDRHHLYLFDQRLYLADPYLSAAQATVSSGCRNVAVDASLLHYDYPLLAFLRTGIGGPKTAYADIQNRSARFALPGPAPCAVICLGCNMVYQKQLEYGTRLSRMLTFDRIVVFLDPSLPFSPTASPFAKPLDASAAASSDPCAWLPGPLVRDALSGAATKTYSDGECVYQSPAGRLSVKELPSAGIPYYQIAMEGVGSLQLRQPGLSATVVFDNGTPFLEYAEKAGELFELNLYCRARSVTSYELLRFAHALDASPRDPALPGHQIPLRFGRRGAAGRKSVGRLPG